MLHGKTEKEIAKRWNNGGIRRGKNRRTSEYTE